MEKEISEIAKLTERIAKDPKSKLFVPLAEEYKKSGDIEMAIHVLTEGLKNNPGYITARSSLGRLLLERGDLHGAQKELEEVVKAIPDNLLAQRKLADIYVLQGRSSDALQRFRTCLTLNPGDKELPALIADLDAGKDISSRIPKPKALKSLEGAKPSDASSPPPAAAKAPVSSKAAAPAPPAPSAVPPAAPSRPPADDRAKPAPIETVALPAKEPAPAAAEPATAKPEAPQPVAEGAGPSAHDEVEIVEEIVELEAVEPLKASPPLQTGEPEQQTGGPAAAGHFDLSEPAAVSAASPEVAPAAAWDAGQPFEGAEQAAPAAAEPRDDINTNTLADLYIAQGFYDKAIEIYQGMLANDPANAVLEQKISAIRSMAGTDERHAASLQEEAPLEQLQQKVTPVAAHTPPVEAAVPVKEQPEPQQSDGAEGIATAAAETPVDELPARPSRTSAGEPAPPRKEPSADPGREASPMPAPQDASTRRQATIARLESWLKNVIKENP